MRSSVRRRENDRIFDGATRTFEDAEQQIPHMCVPHMLAMRLFQECLLRTHGARWSVDLLRLSFSHEFSPPHSAGAQLCYCEMGCLSGSLSEWEYNSADENECR